MAGDAPRTLTGSGATHPIARRRKTGLHRGLGGRAVRLPAVPGEKERADPS